MLWGPAPSNLWWSPERLRSITSCGTRKNSERVRTRLGVALPFSAQISNEVDIVKMYCMQLLQSAAASEPQSAVIRAMMCLACLTD